VKWHVAMGPGKRAALDENDKLDAILDETEYLKASLLRQTEFECGMKLLSMGVILTLLS
jgi:hypothetical protein